MFPHLYGSMDGSTFTFECGDGWFKLIYELSEKLEKEIVALKLCNMVQMLINGKNEFEFMPAPQAFQVKEKWGVLRFNMTTYTKRINDIINMAERCSMRTCEHCGNETLEGVCPSC